MITLDTANKSSQVNNNASGVAWSHTVAAGPKRLLIVCASMVRNDGASAQITGITYGSTPQALTQAMSQLSTPFAKHWRTEIWYLIDPPVGTSNVTITGNNTQDRVRGFAITAYGVKSVLQPDSVYSGTGGPGNNPDSTMTLDPISGGCLMIDAIQVDFVDGQTITPTGSNQVSQHVTGSVSDDRTYFGVSTIIKTDANSTNFQWDWSGTRDVAGGIVAFKPHLVGGAGVVQV